MNNTKCEKCELFEKELITILEKVKPHINKRLPHEMTCTNSKDACTWVYYEIDNFLKNI